MSSKKQAGFGSTPEYQTNLATSPSWTFASFTKYQKDCVKQFGFATVAEYQEDLAQKAGFASYNEYRNHRDTYRANSTEYQNHLAQQRGFPPVSD